MVRRLCDERTRAYVARRTTEGLSDREITRCLKRDAAREVYRALTRPYRLAPRGTGLRRLRMKYDELRSAQAEILVGADHERPRLRADLEDAGFHRDAADLDPRWRSRIAGEEPVPNDAVLATRSPWPAALAARGAGPWPTTDKVGYLRWLAVSDAVRRWVPRHSQLAGQLAALAEAKREAAARRSAPPSASSTERALIAAGIAVRSRFRH